MIEPVDLLGFVAGAVISIAALPRITSILRNPSGAASESIGRNSMLCLGNALWIVFGLIKEAPMLAIMCAIATLLNGLVLAFALFKKTAGLSGLLTREDDRGGSGADQ
jgi:hypothetical protein